MYAEPPRAEADRGLPRRTFTGGDILLGLIPLVLLGSLVVLSEVATRADPVPGEDVEVTVAGLVIQIAVQFALVLTVALLAARRGLSGATLGLTQAPRWGWTAAAVALSYVVLVAYTAALLALDELGYDIGGLDEGNPVPLPDDPDTVILVLLGLAVVAFAPLSEEIYFRAFLFRAFRSFWPTVLAIFLSGLLFGAFHFNLSVLIPFTVIGMIFAWTYLASRSLWTPIIAHAIVNGISFTISVSGIVEM